MEKRTLIFDGHFGLAMIAFDGTAISESTNADRIGFTEKYYIFDR